MEFGEIIEVSSRAFWDDYDRPATTQNESSSAPLPEPELQWIWSNSDSTTPQHPTVKKFILVEGHSGYIRDFRATVLKNYQPLCTLTYHKTAIFTFPSDNVALCLNEEGDENHFALITNMIRPYVEQSEHAFVISTQHKSQYKGDLREVEESDDGVFIRSLCSADSVIQQDVKPIDLLPIPNIITGVAAGVVTLRRHLIRSYSCFVMYMDHGFDSATAVPVLELIERQCAFRLPTTSDYYRTLKTSNLYTWIVNKNCWKVWIFYSSAVFRLKTGSNLWEYCLAVYFLYTWPCRLYIFCI